MNKILLGLKSRTVWMAILIVIINGVPALTGTGLVPEGSMEAVNTVLALLAGYFRLNARV